MNVNYIKCASEIRRAAVMASRVPGIESGDQFPNHLLANTPRRQQM